MDNLDEISSLIQGYHNRLRSTTSMFYRHIYSTIDWEDRLICIKGPKGVGKSTLILQHIRDTFKNIDDALFLSLDNLWFTTHDLYDVATCYYAHGGRYLFLDEVHHYKPWQPANGRVSMPSTCLKTGGTTSPILICGPTLPIYQTS